MSTNQQNDNKRITRQVRISRSIHQKVKFEAIRNNTTISKFLDELCKKYLLIKPDEQKE